MRTTKFFVAALFVLFHLWGVHRLTVWSAPPPPDVPTVRYDEALYQAMRWRSIGPFRGSRVTAVSGVVGEPETFYFGGAGGGLWKTTDTGLNWRPISDGFFQTGSVGAIAVSESDPNVIYVGMGGSAIRANISHGDGVYKSTDVGKTWTHIGLGKVSQIARVRIHPTNPDIVFIAAVGRVFGPNEERGVFRSKDGGETWEKILYRDEKTGAVDLVLHPSNPRVLYASLHEAYRRPWIHWSGGPGSGLFKSVDGGDTWTEITHNPGLPRGILGKMGITVSPAKPDRVWAIVEAKQGGLFRSDDGGETWRPVNREARLVTRAFLYDRVYADPKDPNTVYVHNTGFFRSVDGGVTFSTVRVPRVDNHDLWIDPRDPQRMINGNDGGARITTNGGASWSQNDNQPTLQFYHIVADDRFPYWLYGAPQDSKPIRIASRSNGRGIGGESWHTIGGGESGHIAPRHDDPDIVYCGSYGHEIARWDYRTRQERLINPWPQNPAGRGAEEMKYRFQWTAPVVNSRFDPNVLYYAGNVIFKTTNEGQSWETISPDLTTDDKDKQKASGGPINKDSTTTEYYCTVFALAESFQDPKILWAGSDDGLVHITKDGGGSWQNITPQAMPAWSTISMIEPSTYDAGTAYLAVDRHKMDDMSPYIYKTSDYGKTWEKRVGGIPEGAFIRVVREDPKRHGLLYAGTETGVFVSFDDGASWQSLQLNLPRVSVRDLVVKNDDLVAATHGRSLWILDDVTPLHQITEEVAEADFFLFEPRDAYRMSPGREGTFGPALGENPPQGSVIHYYFEQEPEKPVFLELLDGEGNLIKRYASRVEEQDDSAERDIYLWRPRETREDSGERIPAAAGMNRFVLDMYYPGPEMVPGAVLFTHAVRFAPPVAVPGTYRVRLRVGEESRTREWGWKKDPRIETTQAELQEQFDFLISIRDRITEVNSAVNSIRRLKKYIDLLLEQAPDRDRYANVIESGERLRGKLTAIEDQLIQSRSKNWQDPLNYPPMLDNWFVLLYNIVASADFRPTDQSYEYFRELEAEADKRLAELEAVVKEDLPDFKNLVHQAGFPPGTADTTESSDRSGSGVTRNRGFQPSPMMGTGFTPSQLASAVE